jgi:ATP synthase protein I
MPREVRTAVLASAAVGLLLVVVAALVAGAPAAAGAVIGAVAVVVFFGFGALTVNAVSAVAPRASLVVALLTYTLQVVLLFAVFASLAASPAVGTTIDRGWVAGAVIAETMVWVVAQIVAATRSRQPLYDLPVPAAVPSADSTEASAR